MKTTDLSWEEARNRLASGMAKTVMYMRDADYTFKFIDSKFMVFYAGSPRYSGNITVEHHKYFINSNVKFRVAA